MIIKTKTHITRAVNRDGFLRRSLPLTLLQTARYCRCYTSNKMDNKTHFKTITQELEALKNRVRNYTQHWLTDGEWKESVLRSILRRHLPTTVKVGRGFVITKSGSSKQIDILIYDTSKPILYKDGDLVLVTPDAAKGIIEVKTSIDHSNLTNCLLTLCDNAQFINDNSMTYHKHRFFGLFSYDNKIDNIEYIMQSLYENVNEKNSRLIFYLCLGKSLFIRYWELNPDNEKRLHYKWHAYDLKNIAPAYFMGLPKNLWVI